jgi:RNA polymerase sigma-70 factor (ECF subfamily)
MTVRELKRDDIQFLVERARELDRKALSELCVYFYPKIFRYVFYRVKTREDAEDITSEVFVRVVRSIDRQRGSFQAWIFRIASNLVIDYYRRRAREEKALMRRDGEPAQDDPAKDTERILTREKLVEAMSGLTEEQQQVVSLKFLEGYDNSEIAEIMDKTVGAVKALQFRALVALRKTIGGEE